MKEVLLRVKEDQMQGQSTGISNLQYNLVSVAYHNLEGAQTYQQYAQDAQQNGDQEAAQFFEQARQQAASTGQRALQLLAQRAGQSSSGGSSS
jgi:ABC-type oligopeptide transport system substrate-binding subunit